MKGYYQWDVEYIQELWMKSISQDLRNQYKLGCALLWLDTDQILPIAISGPFY